MEFVVGDTVGAKHAGGANHGASASLDDEAALARLRASYQCGVERHFARDHVGAAQLYDTLRADALLSPQRLTEDVARVTDAYAEGVTALRARVHLSLLVRKNRARLEEERATASDAATKSNENDTATVRTDTSLTRALEWYIEAIDAARLLATFDAKLAHLQQDDGFSSHSAAGAAGHDKSTTVSSLAVRDIDLWLRVARLSRRLQKYTVTRHALETAFQLQSENAEVLTLLIELLFMLSDFFVLLPLIEHTLRLEPYHLSALVLQRHLGRLGLPVGFNETEAFAQLDHQLQGCDPAEVQRVEQHFLHTLKSEYEGTAALSPTSGQSAPRQSPIVIE